MIDKEGIHIDIDIKPKDPQCIQIVLGQQSKLYKEFNPTGVNADDLNNPVEDYSALHLYSCCIWILI